MFQLQLQLRYLKLFVKEPTNMLPQAFISRISSQVEDPDDFLNSILKPFQTSVRIHPVKGQNVELPLDVNVPWCESGFYLKGRPKFTLDPLFHAGAYYVQESSSMFIWQVMEQLFDDKNIRVLDACASPGGKSTLVASWLKGNGLLISNDVIKSRTNMLAENICKWGYANTWITNTDLYVLGGLNDFFDVVLVDAPCSGEGLFRRDPEAIKQWSEGNCELCAGRQRKILAEVIPSIKPGGYLIYSTCTFNPAENDDNIAWLLSHYPMELIRINAESFPEIKSTPLGGKAFYPNYVKGEGFYCCVLKVLDEINASADIRRQKFITTPLKDKSVTKDFINSEDSFYQFEKSGTIHAIPVNLTDEFNEISSVTRLGGLLNIGSVKGKDLIPDHSLAMSIHSSDYIPSVEVDRKDALNYLARQPFELPPGGQGWYLVKFKSIPLGFIKRLPNRFNNYYPMEWRIRMDVNEAC